MNQINTFKLLTMKTKQNIIFISIVFMTILLSCTKSNETDSNNSTNTTCLLTRVSVSDGEFADFIYSNAGKLLSMYSGNGSGSGSNDFYYYDNQNRISYSISGVNDTTYYFYNSKNLLSQCISHHSHNAQNRDTTIFEYNQNNQMIKETHTKNPYEYVTYRYYIYEWGTDGNVQTEKYYEDNQLRNTYTFEYDNMINRLSTERGPLWEPLNRNNTTIIYRNGSVYETNSYSYDANNLPIECIRVSSTGSSIVVSNTYSCK